MLKYKANKTESIRSIDDDWEAEPPAPCFTEANFLGLIGKVPIRYSWDINAGFGNTVRDKIESLVLLAIPRVTEQIACFLEEPKMFWAAAPTGVTTSLAMWTKRYCCKQPAGGRNPLYLGLILGRWKLYEVPIMPSEIILIGYGKEMNPPERYGIIKLHNWV